MLVVLCGLAGATEIGAGPAVAAVRVSDGDHVLQPGGTLWLRQNLPGPAFVLGEVAGSSRAVVSVGGDKRLTWVRPALSVGVRTGTTPLRVGASLGICGTALIGDRGWLLRPGVRARVELALPLGDRWVLVAHGGLSQRGRSGDADLGVGAAWRW